jgi:DNA repair exonuclease SbcCD ATPase subunit
MKQFKLKYAAAYNFLPFGPEGIQIDFSNFKNIVLIRGENKDAKPIDPTAPTEEYKASSNGSGKSSIQELIVYGLYGKTVKRPEKLGVNDVVHNKIGKNCKLELQWNEYRLIRTRLENGKSNTLRLWKSEQSDWIDANEITQGTMAETQKLVEEAVGLTYDSFVNISVFTDDQRSCFLEVDNTKKKEIVENLLSLNEYRGWHDNAKVIKKENKTKIDNKSAEYKMLLSNQADGNRRLQLAEKNHENWKTGLQQKIGRVEQQITNKQKELGATDSGNELIKYQEAQDLIIKINTELPQHEQSKKDKSEKLDFAKNKLEQLKEQAFELNNQNQEIQREVKNRLAERKKKENEIEDLQGNQPGTKCNKCKGTINQENIDSYIKQVQREVQEINLDIKTHMENAAALAQKIEPLDVNQKKAKQFISQLETQIGEIDVIIKKLQKDLVVASQVREPKIDNKEQLIEQEINNLKKEKENLNTELQGKSPFQEIIENDLQELNELKKSIDDKAEEIKELEGEMAYYDYWIAGFGENGIRKWIIDGIIPELNNRVNYWLQFLIDNKITLAFDNQLNETIERNPADGNPYVYYAMSTGQRRRLNLAVSQAFAHIMMLSAGAAPSLVFLDEVSTNVDGAGIVGIYNMIQELAEDRMVFITTHDQNLLQMLDGCDTIDLIHENGFTTLKK